MDQPKLYTINCPRNLGYRRAMHDAGLKEDPFFGCSSEKHSSAPFRISCREATHHTSFFHIEYVVNAERSCCVFATRREDVRDLALVGFDDFDLADLTSPPLTVGRQPAEGMLSGRYKSTVHRITCGQVAKRPGIELSRRLRLCCVAPAGADTGTVVADPFSAVGFASSGPLRITGVKASQSPFQPRRDIGWRLRRPHRCGRSAGCA